MRIKDAISSLQPGRKKQPVVHQLCTVWTEQAQDGPDAVPLPEYPRPQLRRAGWQCLNGWWEYAFRPAGTPMGEADGRILVPFSPETARSGVGRTLQPGECLWYRRQTGEIHLPQGKRLLVHFGAVDERCAVWWNGHRVGSHRNGYLPFSFDVTDYVREEENELLVCVRDDTDRGTACRGKQTLEPGGMYYHAQSGIWQTVWLETVPDPYLADLGIRPLPEEEALELELYFSGGERDRQETGRGPEGPSGSAGRIRITVGENSHSFSMDPADWQMQVRIPVPGPRLWTPEDPVLYSLRIEAGEDTVESYFAMRSFGTGQDAEGRPCLTLNGKPCFFHGVLDQGYWPESLMTAPSDEALVFDIEEMKRLGFNMLRKHAKIEADRWYYHCDRLGMVVWQDMVNGGGHVNKMLETYLPTVFPVLGNHFRDDRPVNYRLLSRTDQKARKRFEKDLVRMIRHLGSHPCIGLWIPFNEGWGQFDALRIAQLVRETDPSRPVDHASGWFDQGGGDVHSVHNYFRKLTVEKDLHRPPRAFVLSEYGGGNYSVPGHAMSEEVYGYRSLDEETFPAYFDSLMQEIRTLSQQGMAGAVYTQVSDIEEEANGLVTYDRKVKKVP